MTLNEFYNSIGGNLDEVVSHLLKEERILKYVLLFPKDTSFSTLEDAFAANNASEAFRAAHTLKGVALNLGFGNLARSSSELTENLRPGSFTEKSQELFQRVADNYLAVKSSIMGLS